jgi:hypothetical protein
VRQPTSFLRLIARSAALGWRLYVNVRFEKKCSRAGHLGIKRLVGSLINRQGKR